MRSFLILIFGLSFIFLSARKHDTISIAKLNQGGLGQPKVLYALYPYGGYSISYFYTTKFHVLHIAFTGIATYKDDEFKRRIEMQIKDGKLLRLEIRDFNNRKIYKFISIDDNPLLAVDSTFHPGNPAIWSASRIYTENSERRFYREYLHEKEFIIENGKFDYNRFSGGNFTNTGWSVNAVPDGPLCKFNNSIRTIKWFKNGIQYGGDSTFFPHGVLRSVYPGDNSELSTFSLENFPNGHRKEEGRYANGSPIGWWYYYDDSLSDFPARRIHYINSEYARIDSMITFYQNGKIKWYQYSVYYQEIEDGDSNKRNPRWRWMEKGTHAAYFPDGKISNISYLNLDLKDTLSAGWYENGNIKYVSLKKRITRNWYENGQLKSEKLYDENGKMIVRKWDEDGKVISTE